LDKQLHIISHDIPYPANYGGVIDIFEKIKCLHADGVKITLHCFYKGALLKQDELNKYCEEVYYYNRSGFLALFSALPFIVASRQSDLLLQRLNENDAPIFFEGVHSCFYLNHRSIASRKKIVRLFNVENLYYQKLAENENSFFKRQYFNWEANKLSNFETALTNDAIYLGLSEQDEDFYKNQLKKKLVYFLPAFLPYNNLNAKIGKGNYLLYHGNLSVNENEKAALWLLQIIGNQYELVIAGKNPSKYLQAAAAKLSNCKIIDTPTDEVLQQLIENAHIHLLPSFNNTGVKLKLLNALFNGRFCITNSAGVSGSGLNALCEIADTPNDFLLKIKEIMPKEFSKADIEQRSNTLANLYNNKKSLEFLQNLLYP
jgi:hypothetical protein